MTFRAFCPAALLFFCSLCGAARSQTTTLRVLYSPPTGATAANFTSIMEVSPGLFYGQSLYPNGTTEGSVWSITSAGKLRIVYSGYAQNSTPGTVAQAPDGTIWTDFYWAMSGGKHTGNYVSMRPNGTDVRTYQTGKLGGDGMYMNAGPPDYIYDIMTPVPNQTYVFVAIDHSGKFIPLHEFAPDEGVPATFSNMVRGADGNFYGVAQQQRCCTPAWVFKITPSGQYTKLAVFPDFPTKGEGSYVTAALDGNVYGVFFEGGTNHKGSIYKVTPGGEYSTLVSFPSTGVSGPISITQLADGNLYGSTLYEPSYLWRYNFSTNQLETLYTMSLGDGVCSCFLTEGMDGKIYGVAGRGGLVGSGTIFVFDAGLPKPQPLVTQIVPASAAAGSTVVLWGQYLLGPTSVQFNGVPAQSVTSTSKQTVEVIVPAGATSGPVTITTANRSYTTTENFTVE